MDYLVKYCENCDIEKYINDFHFRLKKSGKYYTNNICKKCHNNRSKINYSKNKDKYLKSQKEYVEKNNKIVQHDIFIQELKVNIYIKQHLQIAGNS